jgi:hypothetical protein
MLDSYFSHAIILCTIKGSPKVHFYFSDFLLLEILMRDIFFAKLVKFTNSLVEPRTKKF